MVPLLLGEGGPKGRVRVRSGAAGARFLQHSYGVVCSLPTLMDHIKKCEDDGVSGRKALGWKIGDVNAEGRFKCGSVVKRGPSIGGPMHERLAEQFDPQTIAGRDIVKFKIEPPRSRLQLDAATHIAIRGLMGQVENSSIAQGPHQLDVFRVSP